MPNWINWTPEADATIRRMRVEKKSWETIARHFGISRDSVVLRAKKINAHKAELTIERVDRDALPAGHPVTWGVIAQGPWPGPLRHQTPT